MPFAGELKAYQQAAVDQILDWGGSAVLAIALGGGKTPTAIALVEHLLDTEEVEAGLVVVPPNLRRQWVRALERFAPGSNVLMIDGSPAERREQYQRAKEWAEYTVLGHSLLAKEDWNYIQRLPRDFVVSDEVQFAKTFSAKRTKKLKQLGGGFRIGLTGRPIENFPQDIFSVMEWVNPDVLGDWDLFDRTFIVRDERNRPVRFRNLSTLHKRLESTAMVRVSRKDIEHEFPEKQEETFVVDFDPSGASLYRRIAKDLLAGLKDLSEKASIGTFDVEAYYRGEKETNKEHTRARGKIMSQLTCLRMLCDHPDLLRISADAYDQRRDPDFSGSVQSGSAYAALLKEKGLLGRKYGTPKLDNAIEMVLEALESDPKSKVAVYSFFKPVLGFFSGPLEKYRPVLYTGDVSARKKQDAVDAYNHDARTRVFLSSDAGGSGVDLPAGNYHLNFNQPFSAGQLEQRNARLDRVASEHSRLMVMNLLMAGSVEEYYRDNILKRHKLAAASVDGKRVKGGSVEANAGGLARFLEQSVV